MRPGGRITLPKQLRKALGLTNGTCLSFSQLSDGTVVLSIKDRKLSGTAGALNEDGKPEVLMNKMRR